VTIELCLMMHDDIYQPMLTVVVNSANNLEQCIRILWDLHG
jgi:hypothetical protein